MIGSRLPRLEDPALLTGRGCFVDDIALPGALHAAFVRSPHPHALIRGIDAGAARALPGVAAVLSFRRHPARAGQAADGAHVEFRHAARPLLAVRAGPRRSLLCGRTGRLGAGASDRYVAEDAVALVAVDYEVLPGAADCRVAAQPGAPLVRRELSSNVAFSLKIGYGDVEAAFAAAAHVIREGFWPHRGAGHSIEGRGIAVEYRKADGAMIVHASTQKAHDLFNALVALLGLDENRLRVATPDVGGGFGPKLCVYAEDVAVTAAAKLLGRSIKWTEDRREHFLGAVQERDQHWAMEMALDANGRILGIRGRLLTRSRRLCAAGREPSLQFGLHAIRALHGAGLRDGCDGGAHQQGAGVLGARRRLSAGLLRDGAPDGYRGRRT